MGIGSPEKAKEFAGRVRPESIRTVGAPPCVKRTGLNPPPQVGFPLQNLYVDPTRQAYKALELHGDLDGTEGWFFDSKVVEGVRRLFFTKVTGEALKVEQAALDWF